MLLAEFIGIVALLAVVVTIVLLTVRRSALTRAGGIDLCWRSDLDSAGRGWTLGVGRYRDGEVHLFRSFSPLPLVARRLSRRELSLGDRRPAVGTELDLLPVDSVIVRCTDGRGALELAMSEETLTGLRSWLESVPPGHAAGRSIGPPQ